MRKTIFFSIMMTAACGARPPALLTVSGHVARDETWSGSVDVAANTWIDPGVVVTVAPGATLTIAPSVTLEVDGALDASGGTSAAPIAIESTGFNEWFTIAAAMTGRATLHHVAYSGGALITSDTGAVELVDSTFEDLGATYFAMNGGSLSIDHADVGVSGAADHCIFHIASGVNEVSVEHSNIHGARYALMLYSAFGADFRSNNWQDNEVDVDTTPGGSSTADFTGSYFAGALPVPMPGNAFTLADLASAPLADAGPRP